MRDGRGTTVSEFSARRGDAAAERDRIAPACADGTRARIHREHVETLLGGDVGRFRAGLDPPCGSYCLAPRRCRHRRGGAADAAARGAHAPRAERGSSRPAAVHAARTARRRQRGAARARLDADSEARRAREPQHGLTLGIAAGIGYDDNVFRTEDATRSDFIWSLRPSVYLDGALGKHGFRLGYEGDYARYLDFDTEDFYDHRLLARTRLDLTRKVDVNLSGHVLWGHDERGALGARLVASRELDRWREHLLSAELVVGREITRAQIVPSVELSGVRYLNNDQSARDFDRQALWLRGRWRFTPRWWGLVETGVARIEHLDVGNDLDRTEPGLLIGLGWDATARTSGEIKLGALSRDFEDSRRASSTDLTYDARVRWAPKPYSRVTGYARRESLEDASGGLGTLLADTFGLRWRHAFTEHLELDSGIEYTLGDYDSGREDRYLTLDVEIVRTLNRWLDIAARYELGSRESNLPGIDFVDNVVVLELRGGFRHRL